MTPNAMPMMAIGMLAMIKSHLAALITALLAVPGEWPLVWPAIRHGLFSAAGLESFADVLVVLVVGGTLEGLYWAASSPVLRAIEATEGAGRRRLVGLAVRRLGLKLGGLGLFTLGLVGATASLNWTARAPEVVVGLAFILLGLRLAWIVIDVVLAPSLARLRPLPLGQRRAWLAALATLMLAVLAVLALFLPPVIGAALAAPALALALRLLLVTLIALALIGLAVGLLGAALRPPVGSRRGWLPAVPGSVPAVVLIVAVYLLWLFGLGDLALLLATFALVVVAQAGLRPAVFALWQSEIAAAASDPARPDPTLMPSLVLPAARLIVVLIGLGVAAVALDVPLTGMAMEGDPLARLGLRLLGVLALGLFCHVGWVAVRTTIDHRLKAISPAEHQGRPSPQARLLTLLPLLRLTTGVVLLVLFALSALWTLGIEITPLLAGAGVIGIAVGFGAQTLVRDIIAGVFYLAEDVFRVGEYIESGSSTKGTVERITLRTVALRHHNGPLHFVPYGALGTVRNTSRDWVIEKFNLPLPINVDSEQLRKLIKKVGQTMQEDPEFAPLLREPLKGKLYRVEPGVKIFRCKFETIPGMQFELRAEAYKRIEAALKAANLHFADFSWPAPALGTSPAGDERR